MIFDKSTGIELIPGNGGKDCPGNPENGNECCCDECNYLGCCVEHFRKKPCNECVQIECPRNVNYSCKLEKIQEIKTQLQIK